MRRRLILKILQQAPFFVFNIALLVVFFMHHLQQSA